LVRIRFLLVFSMEQSLFAGPVQIVRITDDHKFVLDEKKLKEILYHRRAQGRKVMMNIRMNICISHEHVHRLHLYRLRAIFVKANHLCWTFFFDI
jgi:hypothetical protein